MSRIVNEIVVEEESPSRLSVFLRNKWPQLPSHKSIKKAIQKKMVLLNGRESGTGDWVHVGDIISLISSQLPNTRDAKLGHFPTLKVLYEDTYLAVVVKPAGLATSGSNKTNFGSLLPSLLQASKEIDTLDVPLPIHRLDRETEGLVVVGKTWTAMNRLGTMLSSREFHKHYFALAEGHFKGSPLIIDSNIEGLNAKTEILNFHHPPTHDQTTFFKISLHTGRTHQIRIHLKSIGHPIVGDKKYNKEGLDFRTGLMLAAIGLEFQHPFYDKVLKVVWNESKKFKKYSISEDVNRY